MEEEIDIIELLKRVKEGKAPKRIEIDGTKYMFHPNIKDVTMCYRDDENIGYVSEEIINFDTKIKILDKPIVEELNENENVDIYELARKVNQIIKHINKENKE